MMLFYAALLVASILAPIDASFDNTVCTNITTEASGTGKPPRPILTNAFEVHVEFAVENKRYTGEAHEYFDYNNQRGMIKQMTNGVQLSGYYYYGSNEYLIIDPVSKSCIVEQLSKSDHTFLLGYNKTNGMMFSAAGALRFTPSTTEIYAGRVSTRGILTDQWTSCHYSPSLDASYSLDWYFAAYATWDEASGYPQAPIRAHIKGITHKGSKPHRFEHVYDFFHFRPFIRDPTVFETPAGVSCLGRKNFKPLPPVADAFSFTSETIDMTRDKVTYMKEHFDGKLKMVKYSYRPLPVELSKYGHNYLTEIHDFNTGVSYVTDDQRGNCTASKIPMTGFDMEQRNNSHYVRIRSAKEFFYFMKNMPYSYEGVRTNRGIDCDTWIAPSYTYITGVLSNWEWYFATHKWNQTGPIVFNVPIPIQMRISVPDLAMQYEYNIFHFDREKPDVLKYDVSACYAKADRNVIRFQLPSKYQNVIDANRSLFKYFVLVSITGYAKVSPLRVSNIHIIFSTEIVVTFELLDVAPIKGDIGYTVYETPLATATSTLIYAINNNDFIVLMDDDTFADTIKLVAYGAKQLDYVNQPAYQSQSQSSDKFTGGIMAAVGIPLGVFGAAAGVVLTFLFFK